jgi:acetoacetyl-CoA synthetase
VMVPYLDPDVDVGALGYRSWEQLRADHRPLEFEPVPFDHPLYVLFSSGTTGKPKGLVHAQGSVLLEHLKVAAFHHDLGPGSILFQIATTSWMVWNYGVSALASGSALVCYDGHPTWPDPMQLWSIAAETRATEIGMGAAVLLGTQKAGLRPADEVDLSPLRFLTATGSPLPPSGFRWVYETFDPSIYLSTGSGGTDLCTGLVGGTVMLPVTAGEMACRYLGAAIESFDEEGRPVRNRPGELVITQPMPTMPRRLIGDPDGERYRSSYFDVFPGIWRHGDWITITDRGTCTIEGRSDATLNRGGVRIGTSEIYSVVDAIPGVADSAAVHLGGSDGSVDELVLLVALDPDQPADAQLEDTIREAIRNKLSPRHVPDTIHVVEALPRTLTGKKLELPIKRILTGADPDSVASRGAITNPGALDALTQLRRQAPRG